jgi:hypothetical protein
MSRASTRRTWEIILANSLGRWPTHPGIRDCAAFTAALSR